MTNVDEWGRTPASEPEPAPYGVNPARHCKVCGMWVEALSLFTGTRCQPCFEADPETQARFAAMTSDDLTRAWGGR